MTTSPSFRLGRARPLSSCHILRSTAGKFFEMSPKSIKAARGTRHALGQCGSHCSESTILWYSLEALLEPKLFDASLFGRVSPSTRIRRHVAPFLGEPSSSSFRTSARAKRRDEARQSWPQSISPTAYRVREGHASHYCDQARCSSSISALATRRRAAPHLPDCLGARPLDDVADVLSCFRIGVSAL